MQSMTAKHLLKLALICSLPLIGSNVQSQQNQSASGDNNNEAANRAANLIVTLEHRSPETALDQLEPILDPRGDIGRIADKLVINTTAGNLVELERVLDAFDVPPRRLVLSVDPSFSSSEDIDDRQSMQALEFELNTVILSPTGNEQITSNTSTTDARNSDARNNSATDEADSAQTEQPVSSLSLEAEIIGSTAYADIQTSGISTLQTNYRISMPLGQWVTLEPVINVSETSTTEQQTTTSNQSDQGSQNSQDNTPGLTQDRQQAADFAVRIDILP